MKACDYGFEEFSGSTSKGIDFFGFGWTGNQGSKDVFAA